MQELESIEASAGTTAASRPMNEYDGKYLRDVGEEMRDGSC